MELQDINNSSVTTTNDSEKNHTEDTQVQVGIENTNSSFKVSVQNTDFIENIEKINPILENGYGLYFNNIHTNLKEAAARYDYRNLKAFSTNGFFTFNPSEDSDKVKVDKNVDSNLLDVTLPPLENNEKPSVEKSSRRTPKIKLDYLCYINNLEDLSSNDITLLNSVFDFLRAKYSSSNIQKFLSLFLNSNSIKPEPFKLNDNEIIINLEELADTIVSGILKNKYGVDFDISTCDSEYQELYDIQIEILKKHERKFYDEKI